MQAQLAAQQHERDEAGQMSQPLQQALLSTIRQQQQQQHAQQQGNQASPFPDQPQEGQQHMAMQLPAPQYPAMSTGTPLQGQPQGQVPVAMPVAGMQQPDGQQAYQPMQPVQHQHQQPVAEEVIGSAGQRTRMGRSGSNAASSASGLSAAQAQAQADPFSIPLSRQPGRPIGEGATCIPCNQSSRYDGSPSAAYKMHMYSWEDLCCLFTAQHN